jgi:hypothetical protein
MARRNPTFWGFFSRFGGTTIYFAATGATYAFVKNFSSNIRETDDSWNAAYGGFLAGSIQGLRRILLTLSLFSQSSFSLDYLQNCMNLTFGPIGLSFPAFFGYGTGLAALLYAFDYTGGGMGGYKRDLDADEVARKEFLRKNRRRPIAETIYELGEGRGIAAPGYEERRRERLKETYGIDLTGVPSSRH